MYKQVIQRGIFGKRSKVITVMCCDICNQKIIYSSSAEYGKHLCEKCYKKLKEQSNVSTSD